MVKRGRPKVAINKDYKKKIAYHRKRYRDMKGGKPDYGNKDSLKVIAVQCQVMPYEMLQRFPNRLKQKLHRYYYITLSGSFEIPEEYLKDDVSIGEYVHTVLGEGEYIIKGGYGHKNSKRCSWRALYRFDIREREDGEPLVIVKKIWDKRVRHYWWYKQRQKLR